METQQEMPTRLFRAVHALYVAPIIAAVVGGLVLLRLQSQPRAAELTEIPDDEWMVVINETALAKEYSLHPAQADHWFNGAKMQLTAYLICKGELDEQGVVKRDYAHHLFSNAMVFQATPITISCQFTKDLNNVKAQPRQLVTLRGHCSGFDPGSKIVNLKNCELVRLTEVK